MAKHLNDKAGVLEYDKLISGMDPAPKVASGTLTKLSVETFYKRGTVLARSSGTGGDGKLKILGTAAGSSETLTPDCILCDDTVVGTENDVNAAVYVKGCFNPDALFMADDHSLSQDEKDALRQRGIYLAQLWD